MVSLHNPSFNNAHGQANIRNPSSSTIHDVRSGYPNSNNNSIELLFWHDHLRYYPIYGVHNHKDDTKYNNNDQSNDDTETK